MKAGEQLFTASQEILIWSDVALLKKINVKIQIILIYVKLEQVGVNVVKFYIKNIK